MKEGQVIPQEVLERKRSERATIVYMRNQGQQQLAPVYDLAAYRARHEPTPPRLYLVKE